MPGLVRDPLDVLESQVEHLERLYIGGVELADKETSVVESLAHSNMNIDAATVGRDNIRTMFDRVNELSTILDPSYEDTIVDGSVKTKIVLASETELRRVLASLSTLSDLNRKMSAEPFKDVPRLSEELRVVSEAVMRTADACDEIQFRIRNLVDGYSNLLAVLNRSLVIFDALLTQIEENDKTVKLDVDV